MRVSNELENRRGFDAERCRVECRPVYTHTYGYASSTRALKASGGCVINELQTAGVKLLFSGSVLLLPRFEARHYVTGTAERCPRGVARSVPGRCELWDEWRGEGAKTARNAARAQIIAPHRSL